MFQDSIEKIANFTRPIHTIVRSYTDKQIIPGASTLFFVNEDGYAITCKHVASMLIQADEMNHNYRSFQMERDKLPKDGKFKATLKGLELKYKITKDSIIQLKNNFIDCVDTMSGITTHLHPVHDLAILKFNDYNTTLYQNYAVFKRNAAEIRQGAYLCRLGFPFPEFTNYIYNTENDDIEWANTGTKTSPRFPIDGIITRFLGDHENKLYGIEMSTPGLKGQSGGPLFDQQGLVYGMQYSTKHLHLGFDLVDKEIMVDNRLEKISDYAFIHLGQCIHAETIKAFLSEHQVKYYED